MASNDTARDEIVLGYVTAPDYDTAHEIGRYLVEKNLAACINIYKISSIYRWHGKIEEDGECVIIIKTARRMVSHIESEIKKIHPYEVPCIIFISTIHVNTEYRDWLLENIK